MTPLQFKQNLISEFPNRDIKTSFDLLLDRIPNQKNKYYDLLLIANEFREINQENFQGIAFYENIQVRINRIRKKLLDFIRDLKEPDFFGYTNENGITKYKDGRDGKNYRIIKIFGEVWLNQNLNFNTDNGCGFYDNDPKNGEKYGRLYTWRGAKSACIPGWRLISTEDIEKLVSYMGDKYSYDEEKMNHFFFKTLQLKCGGTKYDDDYFGLNEVGHYWTSKAVGAYSDYAEVFDFNSDYNYPFIGSLPVSYLASCRCIMHK